jgi:hypothetical protein
LISSILGKSLVPRGSSAAPLASTVAVVGNQHILDQDDVVDDGFGCMKCGKNHDVSVCHDRCPWEYVVPLFGSSGLI